VKASPPQKTKLGEQNTDDVSVPLSEHPEIITTVAITPE